MNFILSFCILIFAFSNFFTFAADLETDSRISQVTVYTDSAQITRVANVKLATGEHKVIFKDIVPEVDEDSLRVAGKGSAQVKIFGAQVKKVFLQEPESEKIKQLKGKIEGLKDKQADLENNKEVLAKEREFLDSIKLFSKDQLPEELVTKMPSLEDLEGITKFLSVKFTQNLKNSQELDISIREIKKEVDALNRELSNIKRIPSLVKRNIIVELEAINAGSLELSVSYLVRGVRWYPLYDARTSLEKEEVELISYGMIKQTTGEDWSEVDLALSTAKPSISGKMPEIESWFLRPYLPRVRKEKKGMLDFMTAQKEGVYESRVPVPKEELEEREAGIVYTQPEEKGTAVVYKIARKATVKSDGTEHKVPVTSQVLKTSYEYSATPKLSTYAYLTSKVRNSSQLQLLPGAVGVFLDGEFIGRSRIDMVAPEEEFDLYLGIDEGIKVEREMLKKKVDEVLIGGIKARTRKTVFEYKMTIENYKAKPIKISVFDALPISESDEIVIKSIKLDPEPKEKDYEDKKGVMCWELDLKPKAKQEILITFSVEHPRTIQIEGL